MDFRVEQSGQVRFVYILPFSKRTGLVEFTIFSSHVLTFENYEQQLRLYLNSVHGLQNFKILKTEYAAIPMSNDLRPKFCSPLLGGLITPIGKAAGMIKSSSGYSFKRNQIAYENKINFKKQERLGLFRWRFIVYDSLLLAIMKKNGQEVSQIFLVLFSSNPPELVFRFLDEDTNFLEELQIFSRFKYRLFLRELVYQFPYVAVSLLSFVLVAASMTAILPAAFLVEKLLYLPPLIGLLTIGMAHGSIDYLLLGKNNKLKFCFIYLLGPMLFLSLWWLSPMVAMLFFIGSSAYHFGEQEFDQILHLSSHQPLVRFTSIIWGGAIVLFPIIFHWKHSQIIIQYLLKDNNFGIDFSQNILAMIASILGLSAVTASMIGDFYKIRVSGNYGWKRSQLTLFIILNFMVLPLIPGFLNFFCFRHAFDSVVQQKAFTKLSVKNYIQKAFPFTIFAWLGVLILAGVSRTSNWSNWSSVFLVLGALTTSHMLVISRFLKK